MEGPAGEAGYAGSELITEDGTVPFKVILRCIAYPSGLLEERRRTKSHLLFHAGCVVHHSCTLCWTTPSHGMVGNYFCKLSRQSISGYRQVWSMRYRTWAYADPEQFFMDTFESNDSAFPRTIYGNQSYEGKYGPTRFDGLNFYEWK